MSRLFLRIFHRSDGQWTAVPLKCLYFFGELEYSYCLDIATSIPDVTPYDNICLHICLQCLPGLWVLELVSESDKMNIANDTYLSQTLNWMRFQGRNCHREPRRKVFSRLRIDASSSVTVHDQRSPYLPRSLGMSTLWCLQQGIVLARQDRGRWWRGKRNRQNSSTLSRQTLRTILVQCKEGLLRFSGDSTRKRKMAFSSHQAFSFVAFLFQTRWSWVSALHSSYIIIFRLFSFAGALSLSVLLQT